MRKTTAGIESGLLVVAIGVWLVVAVLLIWLADALLVIFVIAYVAAAIVERSPGAARMRLPQDKPVPFRWGILVGALAAVLSPLPIQLGWPARGALLLGAVAVVLAARELWLSPNDDALVGRWRLAGVWATLALGGTIVVLSVLSGL